MGIAFGRSGMKDRFMKTKIKSTVEHYLLPVKSHASQYWLTTTSEDIRLLYEGYPDTRPARQIYDLNREMSAEYLVPRDTLPLILCHHPSLEESDNLLFHYCWFPATTILEYSRVCIVMLTTSKSVISAPSADL